MRKLIVVSLAGLALLPWQSAIAAPTQGQITRPDPHLLQSYWTSLSIRDGLRERDEVRIEHGGQLIGAGLVVSVTADHSVIMLKGSNPAVPTTGDSVVLSRQAAVLPTVAQASAPQTGYKVVGGHSLVSFSTFAVAPTQFNGSSYQETSFGSYADFAVTPLSFSTSLSFSAPFTIQPGGFSSPGFIIAPTSFTSAGFNTGVTSRSTWGF